MLQCRRLLFMLVLAAPAFALAQETDPNAVADDLPQSSAFWTLFLSIIALPFLGKALSLLVESFLAWRRAKGDKQAETYARLWALAGDAVAYVNAQTKATRDVITSPSSPGGTSVTAEEARMYQEAARAAMMEWLGTAGVAAAVKELGIAQDKFTEWLRGLIQKRFETQRLLEVSSVQTSVPAPIIPTPVTGVPVP